MTILRQDITTDTITRVTTRTVKVEDIKPATWTGRTQPIHAKKLVLEKTWTDANGTLRKVSYDLVTRIITDEPHQVDTSVQDRIYWQMLAAVDRRDAATTEIAVVGGGLFVLQEKLVRRGFMKFDVYELLAEVRDWNEQNIPSAMFSATNWIIGDYAATMAGKYDVIFFDVDETPRISIEALLKTGGQVVYYNEDADVHTPPSNIPEAT